MEMQPLSIASQHSKSFKRLIRLLIWKFKPQQLFCFAQSTSFKDRSGVFMDNEANSECRYCLLMITESQLPTEYQVQRFINSRFKTGEVTVLCHQQKEVSDAITANNRFFKTIYGNSILLHSDNNLIQSEYQTRPSLSNILRKAEKKYQHYIPLIDGFLAGATHCIKNQQYSMCTMMLYHIVQQCTELLIGVHLSCPLQIRSLYTLINLCYSFSGEPHRVWLTNEEDKRLFDLLINIHSEAGFGITYPISEDDLTKLFIKATAYIHLTKQMCRNKIEQLDKEVLLVIPIHQQ
ncbi:hypothetical protein [Pedobacter nyackensis]|uniref:hypothetical protein n=1 Tax=Pedobacter nyackensis TaxID=475255 RepID=UPI00292ED924|nr:hypothetical protein [Pedobacter nyackensis]